MCFYWVNLRYIGMLLLTIAKPAWSLFPGLAVLRSGSLNTDSSSA